VSGCFVSIFSFTSPFINLDIYNINFKLEILVEKQEKSGWWGMKNIKKIPAACE
jgi:hypothetical protein